ncbi:MAG: hypothetical protein FGM24_08265 [Candidatus Kapabacteria bacterium]|nr:hypothetical protein [Candidatus Kapabacteria bacterium]
MTTPHLRELFTVQLYSEVSMPNLDEFLQLGTIVSIISVFVSVKQTSKAMAADVFTTYTDRYANIMKELPSELRGKLFNATKDEIAGYKQPVNIALAQYLDLCSEEYYLATHRMLPKSIWSSWSAEMRQCLASEAVREYWLENRKSYDSNPGFQNFVDDEIEFASE